MSKITNFRNLISSILFLFISTTIFAQWNQLGADIDGEAAGDNSGTSVSLSADGNTVAIGAISNDGSAFNAGHVKVYNWNGSAWVQVGMDIDGEANSDNSGTSVSLSSDGNTVAIGAIFNDGTASNAGHVRVYNWNDPTWEQVGSDINGKQRVIFQEIQSAFPPMAIL